MELGARQKPNNFDTNHDLGFQHRLARDLGMTVSELITRMSAREYNDWVAYYIWEKRMNDKNIALAQAEQKKRKITNG